MANSAETFQSEPKTGIVRSHRNDSRETRYPLGYLCRPKVLTTTGLGRSKDLFGILPNVENSLAAIEWPTAFLS
jgi:hypothetical protein